jgi:hypothetical protein
VYSLFPALLGFFLSEIPIITIVRVFIFCIASNYNGQQLGFECLTHILKIAAWFLVSGHTI